MTKPMDLPASNDKEFWEGETNLHTPKPITICATHTSRKWMTQKYIDNHDGTVSCIKCPWGTTLPGFMKVNNGKILDLRHL